MAWSPIISKYCVVCVQGASAFFASNVYIMLTPSIGFCGMPSTRSGACIPVARFQDRRHNVDEMVELVADAAEVRSDLLGPGERSVECPAPCHRHVRIGLVRAPA